MQRAAQFLRTGVWHVSLDGQGWLKRTGIKALRLGILSVSRFRADSCALRSASLTFFSLMALVPVLALTLAMARAFGAAEMAKRQINRQLDGWLVQMESQAKAAAASPSPDAGGTGFVPSVPPGRDALVASASPSPVAKGQADATEAFAAELRTVVNKLLDQIDNIGFGTLGGIGAVFLLWSVVGTLGKVEESFNAVWCVDKPRPFRRKMCDYLFTIVILPFLILAASTVPVASMVTRVMERVAGKGLSGTVGALLESGLFKTATTVILGSVAFAFLLGFMPNAKVKAKAALTGGFVTAVAFGVWLKLCAMLQVGIGKYSTLYGSFAMLPILLAWIYTSWEIILFGAELTFAVQNRDSFVVASRARNASFRARMLMALALCSEAAKRHCAKEGGMLDLDAFASETKLPRPFAKEIVNRLVAGNLMRKVESETDDDREEYVLVKSGEGLTAARVVQAMMDDGESPEAAGVREVPERIRQQSELLDAVLVKHFGRSAVEL